jgi:hypothetical protein
MRAAKAWIAAAGMVVTALSAAFADEVLNFNEVGVLVTVVLEAVALVGAVYATPNAGFVETGKGKTTVG